MSADPREVLSERGAALRAEGAKALAELNDKAAQTEAQRCFSYWEKTGDGDMDTTTNREKDTTARHTPGPWRIERPAPGNNPIVVAADGRDIALTYEGCLRGELTGAFSVAMIDANARLMAAAPDLLAALEREHEVVGCETDITGEPCSTCAVIAKAEGQAS